MLQQNMCISVLMVSESDFRCRDLGLLSGGELYGDMWENAVRVGGTCKNSMRFSMYDGPMETVEYMWVNIRCMLIVPAKILELEGSISPSSFYGQLPDY